MDITKLKLGECVGYFNPKDKCTTICEVAVYYDVRWNKLVKCLAIIYYWNNNSWVFFGKSYQYNIPSKAHHKISRDDVALALATQTQIELSRK